MTELEQHIQALPLMDTHEHLHHEETYLNAVPDILHELFDGYLANDLISAGAPVEAVERLIDASDPDMEARWAGVSGVWEHCKYTGYGAAMRDVAQQVYGLEEITLPGLIAANEQVKQFRRPGERLRILKEAGNLDHVQIDDFTWACQPDEAGVDFFLYDLSWVAFCRGDPDLQALHQDVGVEVRGLDSLNEAMGAVYAKYGPLAIAVKAQHAYNRTLLWRERDEADVARVLDKHIHGAEISIEERLCLGDWCWARGVELAVAHNLPFKLHTGYHAGFGSMPVDWIKPGNLCTLLARYPEARFVLMHIAYPYNEELMAIAKHYPNVYVDMCWAWSITPDASADFVRRWIHTVPVNKLFGFGGDTFWPWMSVAYARQARHWLTRALQAEIDDGLLTEAQAITLATRFMRGNQEACFDLAGTRAALSG